MLLPCSTTHMFGAQDQGGEIPSTKLEGRLLSIYSIYSKLPVTPWNPWRACLKSHFITRVTS
jgi:hypothetical protein